MDEYIDDMVDPTYLDSEIDFWGNLWIKNQAELPEDVKEVLERKPKSGFANINRVRTRKKAFSLKKQMTRDIYCQKYQITA